jgi:rare lipoprotein A
LGALIVATLFIAGCAHRAATANVPPPPAPSPTPAPSSTPTSVPSVSSARKPRSRSPEEPAGEESSKGYVEEGVASWYGFPFQGRQASDGEIYDMNQMVAAHRTLPFNSIVRVTNLGNGLQTEVRIIDRGPFVEGRIIDLSLAAAKAIDMVGPGTAQVRLEVVTAGPVEMTPSATKTPASRPEAPAQETDLTVGVFAVQIGSFADAAKADKLRDQLTVNYPSVSVQKFNAPTGTVYRVFVGRYTFEAAATEVAAQLQAEHAIAAFVVRVDPSN